MLEFILWAQRRALNCDSLTNKKINWISYCVKPGFNQWKVDYLSQTRHRERLLVCVRIWVHETVWSREGRASCEIGYVWGEHMTAQDTHTHTHTREKTTGRCYSVWPWAEPFLSLWSRKSFKGLVHPNYKKHFSLLPLKQTRIKSIQREYSQGYFLLQLQISTKCITYKQTCRSEQTTAREWSHLSHTLVLIRLYL